MRYGVTFFISFLCFLILQFLHIDNIFAIGAVFLFIIAGVMYPLLRAVLWETDIEKIEGFLLKNRRNPNFYIVYALANEVDEDVKEITEKLLQKYKQKSRQAMYKIGEALYFNNIAEAKKQVNQIKSPSYRLYYQAIILLEDGDIEGANEVIEKLSTEWMKYALLAERERKLDNIPKAQNYADIAKLHARGLQRYLLHKTYERELSI